MNRQAWAWQRFQRRTGWIFGPGETAICFFAGVILVTFGSDAIHAYFAMVRMIGNWIVGSGQ